MLIAVSKKSWMRRFKAKLRSLSPSSEAESIIIIIIIIPLVTMMLKGLTMAFTSSRPTYLSTYTIRS